MIVVRGRNLLIDHAVYSTERFDTLKNKWVLFGMRFPDEYCVDMSLVVAKSRWIYAFGGCDYDGDFPSLEQIRRLDT